MNKIDSVRNINDGWYFFIDIVDSTHPDLTIYNQLKKINHLKDTISFFLKYNNNPDIYKSFTGDGMLIVFLDYNYPLDLSIFIHQNLNKYNSIVDSHEHIYVRIGIGFGSFLSFDDNVNPAFAPWGHELILARRIMELARPNQILLTDFAYQKIKNDYLFDKNDYGMYLFDMGKIMLKHHVELENVYSFYKEGEYGNNSDIEFSVDLKPLILYYKFDKIYNNLIQDFCEARFETILNRFKDLTNPSKGLEIGLLSTGLLYKVLFEHGMDYVSATYLPPGEYWEIQNNDPLNLLGYQERSLNRIKHHGVYNKNFRFLIMEKEILDADIRKNQNNSLLFIKWHSENEVNLFFVEFSDIEKILIKYPKIVHNVGLGFWHGKYLLQFGPIMEYVNPKDQYHPLIRRRFWLHAYGTDTYNQSNEFFKELIKSAESGKMIKVDHNYYNKVINKN